MMRTVSAAFLLAVLSATTAEAKGRGVGAYVQGLVSSLRVDGSEIIFNVRGTIELVQYHGQRRSAVEFSGDTIEVRSRQGDFCFIMIADNSWHPGPCGSGQVQETLARAGRERRPVLIELGRPTVRFGESHVTADVLSSEVNRIYDARSARAPR